MDKLQLIYDLLKETREDIRAIKKQQESDHLILEEHRRCSESNSSRLKILEKRAIFINWKFLAILSSVLSGFGGLVYYLVRIFGGV